MDNLEIKKSIERSKEKFNYKETLEFIGVGIITAFIFILTAIGAYTVIEVASKPDIFRIPENIVRQAILNFGAGSILITIAGIVGYSIEHIQIRKQAKENLQNIVTNLNNNYANINYQSLEQAEIVSIKEENSVITSSKALKEEITDNYIIINSLKGQIVIVKETIERIKKGKEYKLTEETIDFRVLSDREIKTLTKSNEELSNVVLAKKLKNK